jgi:hypothetical protein
LRVLFFLKQKTKPDEINKLNKKKKQVENHCLYIRIRSKDVVVVVTIGGRESAKVQTVEGGHK